MIMAIKWGHTDEPSLAEKSMVPKNKINNLLIGCLWRTYIKNYEIRAKQNGIHN